MIQTIFATKLNLTQTWDTSGKRLPITILTAPKQVVSHLKTTESDGYQAVQLAIGSKKASQINKPMAGHLKKVEDVHPQYLREVRISEDVDLKLGDTITADSVLAAGDFVQVTGTSKGKGFAGGVKRHNFKGGPKTHGQSDRHRAPGSIGQGTDPGRVWPGKRMAGHMGHVTETVTNLTVVKVTPEGEIWIKGLVPGPKQGLIKITKTGTNSKFPGLPTANTETPSTESQPAPQTESTPAPQETSSPEDKPETQTQTTLKTSPTETTSESQEK